MSEYLGLVYEPADLVLLIIHYISPQQVVSVGEDRAPVRREGSLGRTVGTLETREWL